MEIMVVMGQSGFIDHMDQVVQMCWIGQIFLISKILLVA